MDCGIIFDLPLEIIQVITLNLDRVSLFAFSISSKLFYKFHSGPLIADYGSAKRACMVCSSHGSPTLLVWLCDYISSPKVLPATTALHSGSFLSTKLRVPSFMSALIMNPIRLQRREFLLWLLANTSAGQVNVAELFARSAKTADIAMAKWSLVSYLEIRGAIAESEAFSVFCATMFLGSDELLDYYLALPQFSVDFSKFQNDIGRVIAQIACGCHFNRHNPLPFIKRVILLTSQPMLNINWMAFYMNAVRGGHKAVLEFGFENDPILASRHVEHLVSQAIYSGSLETVEFLLRKCFDDKSLEEQMKHSDYVVDIALAKTSVSMIEIVTSFPFQCLHSPHFSTSVMTKALSNPNEEVWSYTLKKFNAALTNDCKRIAQWNKNREKALEFLRDHGFQ